MTKQTIKVQENMISRSMNIKMICVKNRKDSVRNECIREVAGGA